MNLHLVLILNEVIKVESIVSCCNVLWYFLLPGGLRPFLPGLFIGVTAYHFDFSVTLTKNSLRLEQPFLLYIPVNEIILKLVIRCSQIFCTRSSKCVKNSLISFN